MVILHTWLPSVFDRQPDLGHSSLNLRNEAGRYFYVSFWPEPNTITGLAAHHLMHAPTQDPQSLEQEIDTAGDFMRRPSDEADILEGLDEDHIVSGWNTLRDHRYNMRRWNCADVTRFLILHAMDERYYEMLVKAAGISAHDMHEIARFHHMPEIVKHLSRRRLIDTKPVDVARLARAYNRLRVTI